MPKVLSAGDAPESTASGGRYEYMRKGARRNKPLRHLNEASIETGKAANNISLDAQIRSHVPSHSVNRQLTILNRIVECLSCSNDLSNPSLRLIMVSDHVSCR